MPEGQRKSSLTVYMDNALIMFEGRILAFDMPAALIYGGLTGAAIRTGRGFSAEDMIIASVARSNNLAVATRDEGGFGGLGLRLINPWREGAQ